jgi:hypothetical protein
LNDTWQFDLKTNKWTNVTPEDKNNIYPPRVIATSSTIGDKLYVYGGTLSGMGSVPKESCGAPFPQRPNSNEIWCFDQLQLKWSQLGIAGDPVPRLKRLNSIAVNGKMYIMAGWDFIWFGETPDAKLYGTGPGQIWNKDVYCFEP